MIVALIVLNVHTQRTFRNFKPLVIRIDEVGHAAAVSYDSLTYTPQAPELKYFLVQFVTMHYSRMRATVRQQYAQSLYFLDGRLADATMEANKKSGLIERFLTSGGEEIDVRVKNVTLEDLRQPPYRATVDFEKVYLAPVDAGGTQARSLRRPPRLRADRPGRQRPHSDQPLGPDDHLLPRGPGLRGRAVRAVDPPAPTTRRGSRMPFIPRQVKPPARLAISCKVPEETATLLKRYAEFLDSTQDYVVNERSASPFAATRSFRRGSRRPPAAPRRRAGARAGGTSGRAPRS